MITNIHVSVIFVESIYNHTPFNNLLRIFKLIIFCIGTILKFCIIEGTTLNQQKLEVTSKKSVKPKKQYSIEETLWDSANKLRGSVESSEYKHVVLGLIFLKFASDKFEERRQELLAEGKEKYVDMVEFYTSKNVFYLPEISRWSYLIGNAKQNDIALKIDTALSTVEKNNPALKGALPDNYYSRLNLDVSKLAALLDTINNNCLLLSKLASVEN